jgi:hypothetical protein
MAYGYSLLSTFARAQNDKRRSRFARFTRSQRPCLRNTFGGREIRLLVYVCMYISLAPELLAGYYSYSVHKSLSVTLQAENLETGRKTQNSDFHENGCKDFH